MTLGAVAVLLATLARLRPRLRRTLSWRRAVTFLLRRTRARLLRSRLLAALFHARLFARALFHSRLLAFARAFDARLVHARLVESPLLAGAIHAPLALVVALDLPRGGFTHRVL